VLFCRYLNIISDIIQKKLYEDSYNDGKKTLISQSTQPIPTTNEMPMKFEEFADWSCFAVGPKFETLLRYPDNKLCIAEETTKLVASGINLKSYRYIFKSQCFLNISGISAGESEIAIDNYFKHIFDNSIHQSNQFKSGSELVFSELKLVVHAKQGQAIAFCSNFLVYKNLPITTRLDWSSNNEEAEFSQIYTSPKLGSQKPKPKNHQRSHI
ncbi:42421_t:CDS:2, partial [Gigaspora margarita]